MKRVATGFAIALLAASGRLVVGQDQQNPFVGRSDNGEIVHVLPPPAAIHSLHATQPTDALAHRGVTVYPASYGSGNLIDHGGHEIALVGYFPIYWNQTVAGSPGSQGYSSLRAQISAFVTSFSQSPDYSVITQYSSRDAISPVLAWAGDLVDVNATRSSISDSQIRSYIAGLFGKGLVTADSGTIFAVYFPSGMKITMQGGSSCSAFCGYHGHFGYNGQDIKYAVYPYTNCRGCSLNGKAVADMLTIVSSHEIREAVTDPDLNAWYDAAGYEADDKCAWHNLYRLSGTFWVQPEYSNTAGGCVVY